MDETPRLAPHRVRLVVCLLASNWRPVQTSSDLAGFWARLYLAGTLRPDAPLHTRSLALKAIAVESR